MTDETFLESQKVYLNIEVVVIVAIELLDASDGEGKVAEDEVLGRIGRHVGFDALTWLQT